MKILATLDGSRESRAIIEPLRRLAVAAGAQVTLFTVAETPHGLLRGEQHLAGVTPGGQMGAVTAPTMGTEAILPASEPQWAESKDQAIERVEAEALDSLKALAAPLRDAGVSVQEEVAVGHNAVQAILDFARDHQFDLIAMATHGHSGLRDVLHGSVTSAIVRSGVAPVMLVRPVA